MILAALALLTSQAHFRGYSLRQYMAVSRAGNSSYSPSADRVAYLTNVSGAWQLWVADLKTLKTKKLTSFRSGVWSVDWRPDSNEILAVVDDGGNQNFQFLGIDATTGKQSRITTNGRVQHVYGGFTSSGKEIYYADNSRDPKFFDCYVMDRSSGHVEQVFKKDAVLHPMAASADGRLIAVEETHSEVDNDLWVVDRSSNSSKLITRHSGHSLFSAIGFAQDDSSIYYRSNQGGKFMGVKRQELATVKSRTLMSKPHDIDAAILDPQGHTLAISTNVSGYEKLSLVDAASGREQTIPGLPEGIAWPQKFSPDSTHLSVTVDTPVHDDDIFDVDLKSGRSKRVTDSPQGGIDPSSLVLPRLITYASFDGLPIQAILYIPKCASARHPAPVVLSLHGGPEGQEQPYSTNYYQFLISHGYAILAPNVRGSTGYGKSFVDLDNGPLRWNALKDVAYAVRYIASQPRLDSRKVVCFGPSYGGFATLAMLAHYPKLFAGGIDLYGPADLKTFLARTAAYRRPDRMAEYGDPVKDSKFMDAISPAKHASRIKRPLLIVQGKNDPIVPSQESEDMVRLLRRLHRPVEYVLLPNEGHGISNDADYVLVFGRILAFLQRYAPVSRGR